MKNNLVIVPKDELERLEEIRKALWEKFGGLDRSITEIVELQSLTEGIWKIANKKYPPYIIKP